MAGNGFVFPDPMLAVVEILRDSLGASVRPEAEGATVGTRVPFASDGYTPDLPYLLVRSEGARVDSRVVERVTIRVAVWHRSEALGLALAQLARAYLVSYPGDSNVRGIAPLTGPLPTSDPESGSPLCYFTLSVRTRPTLTI